MNRKNIAVYFFMLFLLFSIFADVTFSIGPSYTNYFIRSKTDGTITDTEFKNLLQNSLGKLKNEKNNALGFAIDLTGNLFYMAVNLSFQSKDNDNFFSGNTNGFSLFLDTQAGLGYRFFAKKPFNLFMGGGIGLNTIYANQKITSGILTDMTYKKLDIMVGVGVNILASFYFTKNTGIYLGITDTFYTAPIKTQKIFKTGTKEFTFEQTKELKTINSFANSLNIKAGISFKF